MNGKTPAAATAGGNAKGSWALDGAAARRWQADPDVAWVRDQVEGRPPGEIRLACPKCARVKRRARDDALAVKVEAGGDGVYVCFRCGWRGGWRAPASTRWPAARSRGPHPAHDRTIADQRGRDATDGAVRCRLAEALACWRRALPIEHDTIAAAYFRRRGCAAPPPPGDRAPWWPAGDPFAPDGALRWLPDARHPPSGWRGPAIVALVTDVLTGEPMTLARTWLAPDGSGKAPIERPRLLWPGLPKKGGVVRLTPDAEVTQALAVAEGIETALALAHAFPAVWACLDAGNLASFPVLHGIEVLTIAADHDDVGIKAAETCARRWHEAGLEVKIVISGERGTDFADISARVLHK